MVIMIAAIGLVLIVTIILLMGAWRRHLNRSKPNLKRERPQEEPDIWQAGGQRLLAEMHVDGESVDGEHEPPSDNDYDDGYPREEPF